VVHRHNLRSTIGSMLAMLTKVPAPADLAAAPTRITVPALADNDDLAEAPVAQAASE
jgi:acetyl-CoA carboxylase carboxyl transferase subunit beta